MKKQKNKKDFDRKTGISQLPGLYELESSPKFLTSQVSSFFTKLIIQVPAAVIVCHLLFMFVSMRYLSRLFQQFQETA